MKLAIIRIRGDYNLNREERTTLELLSLTRKNTCVLKDESPTIKGMLNKVQHLITWGFVDSDTEKLLEKCKGKNGKIHLSPPKKGYGRKGIKISFAQSGAYGDRKEKINNLLQRMV
ncbi:uL30 family ribosomal protein [Candidatus Woesearchaeota archaeon]|nr:uL30 family ribosomal protein [Candidatus Woesearchaeota archaeon]